MKKAKILFLGLTMLSTICVLSGCDSSNENKDEITEEGNETVNENLYFYLNEDKNGYIVGDCRKLSGDVEIPDTYNSLPVVGISSLAFHESKITSLKMPNTILYIKDDAFNGCGLLKSIKISNKIASIGEGAFSGCTSLESIEIPDSVTIIEKYTFSGCKSLTNIEIPDSVTSIGEYAFSGCSGAMNIKISNKITAIEPHTFSGCTSLRYIDIPEGVTSVGNDAFYLDSAVKITLPASLKNVDRYAFSFISNLNAHRFIEVYNLSELNVYSDFVLGNYSGISVLVHSSLNEKTVLTENVNGFTFAYFDNNGYLVDYCGSEKEVVLPDKFVFDGKEIQTYGIFSDALYDIKKIVLPNGMTSIGDGAFGGCASLENIEIPNSVTSIGEGAFAGCAALKNIEIPNSVTSIGEGAFFGCKSITSIEIPESVTSIGAHLFGECESLTRIIVNDNNTIYDSRNECNAIIRNDDNCLIAGCGSTIIPDDVTVIDNQAFMLLPITTITISSSVKRISSEAFSGCKKLNTINYLGSMEDWSNIKFGFGWNLQVPATKVICSDGEVNL